MRMLADQVAKLQKLKEITAAIVRLISNQMHLSKLKLLIWSCNLLKTKRKKKIQKAELLDAACRFCLKVTPQAETKKIFFITWQLTKETLHWLMKESCSINSKRVITCDRSYIMLSRDKQIGDLIFIFVISLAVDLLK